MKIYVGDSYKNDEKEKVCDVKINEEIFRNISVISVRHDCNNCKYRRNCPSRFRLVRKFDCEKNAEKVKVIFNIVTSIGVAIVAFLIYNKLNYSFLVETAALISFLVICDALCCFISFMVKYIRDNMFYKKLKKHKKVQEELLEKTKAEREEKKKKEEIESFIEKFEELKNNPNFSKIKLAKDYVENVKKFTNSIDFGIYNEKTKLCVQTLEEIVIILENDNSRYHDLIELFEIYLPNFYKALRIYSNFIKEGIVRSEYEILLGNMLQKFNEYLENVKQEITFERGSDEIQFETTAETLTNLIDNEGGF